MHTGGERSGCYIWPEILRTCRLIYQEASPSLDWHGENRFLFKFQEPDNLTSTEGQISRENQESLERQCPQIFRYTNDDWQEHCVPSPLSSSLFAAFLSKIGPIAAHSLSSLSFLADNCDLLTEQIRLLTILAQQHLPSLISLSVHVKPGQRGRYGYRIYGESPECYHFDSSSPYYVEHGFHPMYNALTEFVDGVGWLERFDYDGKSNFGPVDDDDGPSGWTMLKRLEAEVRRRKGTGETWNGMTLKEHREIERKAEQDGLSDHDESGERSIDGLDTDEEGPADVEYEIDDLLGIMRSFDFL